MAQWEWPYKDLGKMYFYKRDKNSKEWMNLVAPRENNWLQYLSTRADVWRWGGRGGHYGSQVQLSSTTNTVLANMGVCTPDLTNEITITNAGIQALCVCVCILSFLGDIKGQPVLKATDKGLHSPT